MARCVKCGRKGTFTGDLCNVCQSGVTYHYVEQRTRKKVTRRKKLRAILGALYPEDKPLRKKQTVITIIFVILLLAAMILLRPHFPGGEEQQEQPYGEESVQ